MFVVVYDVVVVVFVVGGVVCVDFVVHGVVGVVGNWSMEREAWLEDMWTDDDDDDDLGEGGDGDVGRWWWRRLGRRWTPVSTGDVGSWRLPHVVCVCWAVVAPWADVAAAGAQRRRIRRCWKAVAAAVHSAAPAVAAAASDVDDLCGEVVTSKAVVFRVVAGPWTDMASRVLRCVGRHGKVFRLAQLWPFAGFVCMAVL